MKWQVPVYCLLLSSCASPHDRQNVSRFDGDWQAVMHSTESVQLVEGMRFDCSPFTEPFFLRVQGGVASGFLQADENYSFTVPVDKKGRFVARMPTNSFYTYKNAETRHESAIVLMLEGKLADKNGFGVFVIGDTALKGQGCSTAVKFESV